MSSRRFWLFVYGTPNILGSALALLGLGLFFAGVIKRFWPLIVIGLYLCGHLLAPRQRGLGLQVAQALDEAEMRQALDRLLRAIRSKVPPEVLERVRRIRDVICDILPRLQEVEGGDYQVHVIRQTATDYLPELLETYVRLPPAFARLHPVRKGKTARDLLNEQLGLIEDQLQTILADIHHRDTQALLSHGEFLKQKFQAGTGSFLD